MTEADCIFCRIGKGEVPSEFLYRDEEVMAIRDIRPRAPIHILVMPLAHIPTLTEVGPEHTPLLGKLIEVLNQLAASEGVAETGYRVVINNGPDAGMEVPHLHLHLLGGRRFGRLNPEP